MMTTKFLSGSAIRLIFAIGSPSTSNKSASAPTSTTPSLPGYGLRLPDHASSSALVPVAIASASAGPYQRTSEARIAPCFCASAWENRPIVFANVNDPVGSGMVESLARPGGNATGFMNIEFGQSAKWLELLKQ